MNGSAGTGLVVWVDGARKFKTARARVKFLSSKNKMGKRVNCSIPNCLNNFRNNPGLQYYRIRENPAIRKEYQTLLRNVILKINSDNTRNLFSVL